MNEGIKNAPIAVTVCDASGTITEMNRRAGKVFEKRGGLDLIGANLAECHPEPSKTRLLKMLAEKPPVLNAYTIEKNGVKKLIYQFSAMDNGSPSGLVELSLNLPPDMPHFVRK
jgi:PAS domain-containing protein